MSVAVLQADKLNLPETFAVKLRGKKVELVDNGDATITIKPVRSAISEARGMLKGSNFGTHTILEQKRLEKELEYGE
jgi:hypothetical protein